MKLGTLCVSRASGVLCSRRRLGADSEECFFKRFHTLAEQGDLLPHGAGALLDQILHDLVHLFLLLLQRRDQRVRPLQLVGQPALELLRVVERIVKDFEWGQKGRLVAGVARMVKGMRRGGNEGTRDRHRKMRGGGHWPCS